MNWSQFVAHVKSLGYSGPDDDFAQVQLWLKANDHDTDVLTDRDGNTYQLKTLHANRPGRPMDVSSAVAQSEEEAKIDALVSKRLQGLEDQIGVKIGGTVDRVVAKLDHVRDRVDDDPQAGYRNFGEFCSDVRKACSKSNPVLTDKLNHWQTKDAATTYGNEGTGADGGFAVPQQFRDRIVSHIEAEDSIVSMCDRIPMSSNSILLPDDENAPWDNSTGIRCFWEGEAQQYTQTKPILKQKELRPRKLTCLVPVTEELLEDSTAMGSYVTRKASEKMDFQAGEAIFRGTGAGQPLGFLNGGSVIEVAKVGSQVADTISGKNLVDMWGRCYSTWRRNAVWFASQDADTQLLLAHLQGRLDTGGLATEYGSPVYMPAGGFSGSPFATIFGRPVIVTEHCNTVGDVGDIVLASMGQYLCGMRSGLTSQTSMHLFFDQDMITFKFRLRMDGQPAMSAAISPRSGSNTMSAFVTLAARA